MNFRATLPSLRALTGICRWPAEPSPPADLLFMPEDRQRHRRRKRIARLYLCGIILLVVTADLLLVRFAFSEANPFRALIGFLFGQMLASALLVVGVWHRLAWARYVLMLLFALTIAIFGMVALILGSRPDLATGNTYVLLTGGILLLLIADGWLLFSRRLHYLATSGGSGG